MGRCPILLHPLLMQGVGAFPHGSLSEPLKHGDVTVSADSRRVAFSVLEEKWADNSLPAERAPHGHLG